MTSRWYRSRLFWFGLPGLLLLLWLWLGHLGTVTRVQWATSGSRAWIMAWGGGSVGGCVSTERVFMMPPGFRSSFTRIRGPVKIVMRHFAGVQHWSLPLAEGNVSKVFEVEHLHGKPAPALVLDLRLLAIIHTALWLGGLTAWQRRKHRLLHRTPELPAVRASASGW